MLVLAIILLALVAALVVASFIGASEEVVIELANVTVTSSVGGVFVTGVVAGLVALASLVAVKVSISRRRQHQKEVRELRRRAEMAAPATTTTSPAVEPDRSSGDAATRDDAEASSPVARDETEAGPDSAPRERTDTNDEPRA